MASIPLLRFSSTTPHFFKIILEDTSRHKLEIPKKFVMKYGKDLSSSVYLKLPSGSEWEVELTRCNSKVWFEKGWPQFCMFSSLDYGSFLVFRYEGNSQFHVCIFDVSATEIDYPITLTPKTEEADEDDDLSIKILGGFHTSPKTRRSPLPSPSSKKRRTNFGWFLYRGRSSFLTKDGGSYCRTQRFSGQIHHEVPGRMMQSTEIEKADAFKSDKPPSFRIAMQPSSIKYSMASIPNEFAKRYLLKLPAGIAILKVSDGRTWPVNFKYDHANSRGRLMKGWSPFVRDNSLKVGDVCVFTLVNSIEVLFEVSFDSIEESANCQLSTGHEVGTTVQVGRTRKPIVKDEPVCSLNCDIGES